MPTTRTPAALVVGLIGFVAILGAYCSLVITGNGEQANGLISAVVVLLTGAGIIGHSEARTREQNSRLQQIEHQTNGVLDKRITEGAEHAVRRVLIEAGLDVQPPNTQGS